MSSNAMVLKSVLFGVLLMVLLNICLSLGGAMLVLGNKVPFDAAPVLAVLSVLVSGAIGGLFCAGQTGKPMAGYICGASVFILLAVMGFAALGADISGSALLKTGVSVFVGVFLGNCFGRLRYNKLRKNGKKRAVHIK